MTAARRREGDGQIIAMFAVSLAVILLITGLVIDGGNVFTKRRDAQNAADIAALAATKRLADHYAKGEAFFPGDNAYSAIALRLAQNDCLQGLGSDCTWTANYVGPFTSGAFADLGPVGVFDTAPPGSIGVKVDVTRTARTYLLGVMGQGAWTVQTTATAIAAKPSQAPAARLLPIAIVPPATVQENTIYSLTRGVGVAGTFGWLRWTGGSLKDSMCEPDNPSFTLPMQFEADHGSSPASEVAKCLDDWITPANQVVLVPIIEPEPDPPDGCDTTATDPVTYCVTAIAAFVLIGRVGPPIDKITGRFVATIPYSAFAGSAGPGGLSLPPDPGSEFYYMGLAE